MKARHILMAGLFLMIGLFCLGQGTTVSDSIISGGMYRKFRLYIPANYTGAQQTPLVIDLHGYTSNALQEQLYSNFMPIADTANFLLVYPEGTEISGSPFWNAGITASPNDVLFVSDLIDSLKLSYNINIRRIYSCGMSNGGIMSYYLACQLHNRIAAIASVAGTMFNSWFSGCSPPRPVPVMEIHGTGDAVVPYTGDSNFKQVDSVVKKWVLHNGCTAMPMTFSVPNVSSNDNSYAVNYKYANGTAGSSVELYKVFGGSHSWPGAFVVFANTNQDFNASVEIWRFFRQYSLDQFVNDVGIHESELKRNIRLFPNPASDVLMLEGAEQASIAVFSPDGRRMIDEQICRRKIDVSLLPAGVYFLQVKHDREQLTIKFIKS